MILDLENNVFPTDKSDEIKRGEGEMKATKRQPFGGIR